MESPKTPEQKVLLSFADDIKKLSDRTHNHDQESIAKSLGVALTIADANLMQCKSDETGMIFTSKIGSYGNQIDDVIGEMFDGLPKPCLPERAKRHVPKNNKYNFKFGVGKYGDLTQ